MDAYIQSSETVSDNETGVMFFHYTFYRICLKELHN